MDLETTGLSPQYDTIIECAFVKIDAQTFKEIDRFHSFINPERDIPALISEITHIYNNDVADAPIFSEVLSAIQDFIGSSPLIWHNIAFDISFLHSHGIHTRKNPIIDTFILANFLKFREKSLNLEYLAHSYGYTIDAAHRAIDDTLATARLFEKLIEELKSLSVEKQDIIHTCFSLSLDTWIQYLKKYIFWDKKILTLEDIQKDYIQKRKRILDDKDDKKVKKSSTWIKEFLSENPDFELRENQKRMLDTVDNTLKKWEKIIIEAPTGTGKTFAYLLPAIEYALQTEEKVHISTSTKALQDQIFYNDLCSISEFCGNIFSYTKLKGKRNYLSFEAFFEFIEVQNDFSPALISFLIKIFLWSSESEFGELDELNFYGAEFVYIGEVHAGNSGVFSDSNPYKDLEFAYIARKRAQSSDIIVTNNHILFQDMISEWGLLWGVKNLIIDEAHSLEDIVTRSLKQSISYKSIDTFLEKLAQKSKKYPDTHKEIVELSHTLRFDFEALFSIFEGFIFEKFSPNTKYKTTLINESFFSEHPSIRLLTDTIISHTQKLIEYISTQTEAYQSEIYFLQSIIENLKKSCKNRDYDRYIYYVEHTEHQWTQLYTTVLSPGKFMAENLWNDLGSVILTSATLDMQDDFNYIRKSLALEDFQSLKLESDFNYAKQAPVYIPNDLGSIKNNIGNIQNFLEQLISSVKGRVLVLFTSYGVIKDCFSALSPKLSKQGTTILAQSISGGKHKQIELFKQNAEKTVLFWTDTFWEWIDIPGDDLRYLVIHKFPFDVPTDPIVMARSKQYQDAFSEYSIPRAILKLKQWFGRLIRSKTDSGVVILLDDRIFSSSWGERFYAAFPADINIKISNSQKLFEVLN